jgi:hypothetical protein
MCWFWRAMVLGWVSCGTLGWGVEGVFKVEMGAGALRPELAGVQAGVMSVAVSGRVVEARVGYRNVGTEVVAGKLAVPSGAVRLESARLGRVVEAVEVEAGLKEPVLEPGLRPGTMRMGTVRFELPEGDDGAWLEGPLTLTVPPFSPISFRLEAGRRFEPVDLKGLREKVAREYVMRPVAEAVAAFSLKVEEVAVGDGRVVFEVVAGNATRFPLTWTGKLGLRDLRVLTEESELLEPLKVEGALAEGLAPEGVVWMPGQVRRGRAGFALPHAHAAGTLSLLMPGYEPLALVHDAVEGGWLVVKRAVPEEGMTVAAGVEALAAEERRFAGVVAFWGEMGKKLQGRDQAGYLAGFAKENGVREAMAASLAGMVRVPISWVEFAVPSMQKLAGSELEVTGLLVEMRCLLAGLPRQNEFVVQWRCDLKRASVEGGWRVTGVRVEGREPFWERGFTEVLATEHFLVFYQLAASDGAKRARTAGDQLEKAWERLQKTPVVPGARYAAFVIPEKADFRALTGRDPGTFSGATSAAYGMREGEMRVLNQAMYVNDSHFSAMQRSWGKPDRLVTMQHELVHLALAQWTRPWTPAWLVEGVATYYAGQLDGWSRDQLRSRLPGGRVLTHLSGQPFMGAGVTNAEEVWVQYHYSAAAVRWIERRFGEAKLLELYEAFARVKPKVWENGEGAVESARMREGRVALAEEVVKRVLGGWELDQVDGTMRLELGR